MATDTSTKEPGAAIMAAGPNETVSPSSEKERGAGSDYSVGSEIVKDWSDEEEKRLRWKYDAK
jgi:hypothetical protein